MTPAPAKLPATTRAQRFKQLIVKGFSVRVHMSLILAAVIASGVLTSKLLLELGVHSLRLRYPLAVLGSYLVFLGLVRVWIWYVCSRKVVGLGIGNFDLSDAGSPGGSTSGGGGAPFRFGGGTSGGGGASDLWAGDVSGAGSSPASGGSSTGSSLFGGLDLDLDLGDDGWWILLILLILAVVIICAGGYLVWVAPHVLPEAAWQAVLASTLVRASKKGAEGWMRGVLKSSAIPFFVVMLAAGTLGWVAHRHCPQAAKLVEALACVSAQ